MIRFFSMLTMKMMLLFFFLFRSIMLRFPTSLLEFPVAFFYSLFQIPPTLVLYFPRAKMSSPTVPTIDDFHRFVLVDEKERQL